MCNLYTVRVTGADLATAFNATAPSFEFAGDADFYPKSLAPLIRHPDSARIVDQMRWGFPPPMAARGPVTNVCNLASPFWKSALARPDRRCLVPVTRFCEWEGEKGSKIKRWFSLPAQQMFAFAGLCRPTDTGAAFAFITCEPNPLVAADHPKAMAVLLHPEEYDLWLSGSYDDARACAAVSIAIDGDGVTTPATAALYGNKGYLALATFAPGLRPSPIVSASVRRFAA